MVNNMLYDDIGSFPLPQGIDREWVENNLNTKEYEEMVQRAFLMKTKAGVECPSYPQFQEMVKQFADIIQNPEVQEDVYLVSPRAAVIPELKPLVDMNYDGPLRVCITGPFELYYKEFGGVIYDDIIENISLSLFRFAKNAINSGLNVKAISVDEPSLGTNPEIQPTKEQLERALKHFNLNCDIQIHLHSSLFYTSFLELEEADVLGVEAAKEPEVMDAIDIEDLDAFEKKLRIGVARSDIDNIFAEYNQLHGVNAWQDTDLMKDAINEIESPDEILKRLQNAYNTFGERMAYTGPDCGLFSFPNQEIAAQLLSNVSEAVKKFKDTN